MWNTTAFVAPVGVYLFDVTCKRACTCSDTNTLLNMACTSEVLVVCCEWWELELIPSVLLHTHCAQSPGSWFPSMHLAVTDVVVSPEDSSWMKGMDGSVFMWHLWTGCASEVVGGCPRITSVQWVSDRRLTGAVSKTVISLCLTPMYGLWSTDLTFQIKHLQSIPHQGTNYSRRSVFIWSAAHIIFTAKREKKKII